MNKMRRATLLAACALLWAGAPTLSHAQGADSASICARASLTNPEVGTGGMGGTGIVAGSTSGATGGMGGTGAVAGNGTDATGGMGGTGIVAELTPGFNAAGTGGMGGTGIVGIITGFASVCVNGIEVHYDNRTPVAVNGQAAATRDLAVGQMVLVHAGMANGQMRATGIGAIDAVRGTVTSVNVLTREMLVMGQTVRIANAAGADIASINPGASVRVSGLRTEGGIIVASRVDAAPAGGAASLLGIVSSVDGNSAIVHGTRVNLPPRTQMTVGTEVFVSGQWNGSTLQASRVEAQPVANAIARTERAIVEGYVTRHNGNQISVGAIALRLSDQVRFNGGNEQDATVGRKVQVEMRRVGDAWLADRVIVGREDNPRGNVRGATPGASGTGSGSRGNTDANSGREGGNSDNTGSGSAGSSGISGGGAGGGSGGTSGGSSSGGSRSGGSSSGGSSSGGSSSGGSSGRSSGSGSGRR
jgi:hypothetical protein